MKNLAVCLLAAATVLPALASPQAYNIIFTVSDSFYPGTPSGSFTYDSSAGFSNFIVNWGSTAFDLTSSANAPFLASDPVTGCSGGGSNHQYGFLLITQSATGCAAAYVWSGMYWGAIGDGTSGYSQFFFILGVGAAQDEVAAAASFPADPSTFYNQAVGNWTVTEAPEPGPLGMILFGGLAMAYVRIKETK